MSPPRRLLRDRAAVAFGALFLLLASAIVDLVIAWLDPRIRRAGTLV